MAIYQRTAARVDARQMPPNEGPDLSDIATWCGGRITRDAFGLMLELSDGDRLTHVVRPSDWILKGATGPAFALEEGPFRREWELAQ